MTCISCQSSYIVSGSFQDHVYLLATQRTANHFIIAHSINIFNTKLYFASLLTRRIIQKKYKKNISESATRPRIRPGLCNTIFLLDSYILEWPITLSTSFRAKTCLGNVNEAMNNLDRNILHHNGCSSRR